MQTGRRLLFLLPLLLFLPADGGESGDPADYDGKYREEKWFRSTLRKLPSLEKNAWKRLEREVGVLPQEIPEIRWRFFDLSDLDPKERKKQNRVKAEWREETLWIHLPTEPLSTGEERLEHALPREFLQATLERISTIPLKKWPRWGVDGLTAYASGDVDGIVRRILLSTRFDAPEEIVEGLEVDRKKRDIVESMLSIRHLYRTCKPEAVGSWVKRVAAGEDYGKALVEVTGKPWGPLLEEIDASVREQLETWTEGLDRFEKTYEQYKGADRMEKYRNAKKWLPLVSRHPDAYWVPRARYNLARSYYTNRLYSRSAKEFSKLLNGPFPTPLLYADSRYFLAMSRVKLGKPSAAEPEFRRYLLDHPGAKYEDESLFELAQIRAFRKDRKEAAALVERLAADHPDSKTTKEAQKWLSTLR